MAIGFRRQAVRFTSAILAPTTPKMPLRMVSTSGNSGTSELLFGGKNENAVAMIRAVRGVVHERMSPEAAHELFMAQKGDVE